MKRSRRPPRPAPPTRPTPRRSAGGLGRLTTLAIGLLVLGAVAVWWFGPFRRPSDPLSRLSPEAAGAEGARLMDAGRSLEAVPYFDRAIRADGASFALHRDRANALFNTLFETDTIAGLVVPHVAASDHRVRLMRRALDDYAQAVSLAATPAERAAALRDRGNALVVWGFAWEAALDYRDAIAAAPGDTALERAGRDLLDTIRFPSGLPTVDAGTP